MDDYNINLRNYDVHAATAEFTDVMHGSDNGSLADSTMPLPGPMLTYVSVITCPCLMLNVDHKATLLYSGTKIDPENNRYSRIS